MNRRERAMVERKRRFDLKENHMFKDIINELCRIFRTEIRDTAMELGSEIFRQALKIKLDKFWSGQPWYVQLFRKQIMSAVYRETFGKI